MTGYFEKTISVEEQEKREKEWKDATDGIDWSKLGENIKSFFGTDEQNADGKAEEEDKSEEKKDEKSGEGKKEEKVKDEKDKKDKEKKDDKDKKEKKEKEKPKEPKKPKVETVKVDLSTEGSRNDIRTLEGESFEVSKTKLDALAKADEDRIAVEAALNEVQGYSVDLLDKLEDEEFQSASTDEEREKLRLIYLLNLLQIILIIVVESVALCLTGLMKRLVSTLQLRNSKLN